MDYKKLLLQDAIETAIQSEKKIIKLKRSLKWLVFISLCELVVIIALLVR